MSETKKCPYCGEEIKAEAKKCRYCGEFLPEDETPKEKPSVAEHNEVTETPKNEPIVTEHNEVTETTKEEQERTQSAADLEELAKKQFPEVIEKKANVYNGAISVGGKLYIDATTFRFEPHSFNIGSKGEQTWRIKDIKGYEKDFLTFMGIYLKNGKKITLNIWKKESTIEELEARREVLMGNKYKEPIVKSKTKQSIIIFGILAVLIIGASLFFSLKDKGNSDISYNESDIEATNDNEDASDSSAEVYQLEAVEDASLMHGGPELVQIGSFGNYDYYVMSEYAEGYDERGCPAELLLYRLTGGDPSTAAGIDLSDINKQRGSDDEAGYNFRADIIMDYILRDGDLFLILQDSRDMEEKEASMALVKLNLDTYKATIIKLKEVIAFGDDRETVTYADSYDENAQAEEVNLSDL